MNFKIKWNLSQSSHLFPITRQFPLGVRLGPSGPPHHLFCHQTHQEGTLKATAASPTQSRGVPPPFSPKGLSLVWSHKDVASGLLPSAPSRSGSVKKLPLSRPSRDQKACLRQTPSLFAWETGPWSQQIPTILQVWEWGFHQEWGGGEGAVGEQEAPLNETNFPPLRNSMECGCVFYSLPLVCFRI